MNKYRRKTILITNILFNYLVYELKYIGVVLESFNRADVIGLTESQELIEYEIKSNKSEFMNEFRAVKSAFSGIESSSACYHKYNKHHAYLKLTKDVKDIPNKFYFVVPIEIEDFVVKKLAGLPYGVISIGKYTTIFRGRPVSKIVRISKIAETLTFNSVSWGKTAILLRSATTDTARYLRKFTKLLMKDSK